MVYVHSVKYDLLLEIRPNSFLIGANSWHNDLDIVSSGALRRQRAAENVSILEKHSLLLDGLGYRPCGHSSTCFSCRHRSPEGELLAGDGQVAEMGQLPGATLRFYEQEPKNKTDRFLNRAGPEHHSLFSLPSHLVVGATHQPSTLATQACVLEPGPHVLMRVDHKRPHHQNLLPVLHNTLAALEHSEARLRLSSAVS